jgi:hypothetical protein
MVEEDQMGDDKENCSKIMNSDELMEAVDREGILVFKNGNYGDDDLEKRQVKVTNGLDAYFVMLASDMLSLAEKYKRDIEEVHKMFYQLNCDREKLVKCLEG